MHDVSDVNFERKPYYDIVAIAAKNPQPTTVTDAVCFRMKDNGGACFNEQEIYLMPPGISGSRFFDQAMAVQILLKHDEKNDKAILKMMKATPTLTTHEIWKHIVKALKRFKFEVRSGRIVGMLEHKPENPTPETVEDSVDSENLNPNAA